MRGTGLAAWTWAAEGAGAASSPPRAWALGLPEKSGAFGLFAPAPEGAGSGLPAHPPALRSLRRTRLSRSALRLHWPRTLPRSPALQGRAHPLPMPAVGGLASQLNPVSHPSPAPAAHPALVQVATDQNGIQRGLCFPSPRRRDTRACPLLLRPPRRLDPRIRPPPLFAPSCAP